MSEKKPIVKARSSVFRMSQSESLTGLSKELIKQEFGVLIHMIDAGKVNVMQRMVAISKWRCCQISSRLLRLERVYGIHCLERELH